MFVLGHVGIGSRLLFGLRRRLPRWPLYLGCVLPDLIDKPIYYLGGRSMLISGTRTVGHTGIFFLVLLIAAFIVRRAWLWAIVAGVATHLFLDVAGELVIGTDPDASIWIALFFPAYGVRFPVAHFHSLLEHLEISAQNAYVVGGEIVGGLILLRSWLRRRRELQSS